MSVLSDAQEQQIYFPIPYEGVQPTDLGIDVLAVALIAWKVQHSSLCQIGARRSLDACLVIFLESDIFIKVKHFNFSQDGCLTRYSP